MVVYFAGFALLVRLGECVDVRLCLVPFAIALCFNGRLVNRVVRLRVVVRGEKGGYYEWLLFSNVCFDPVAFEVGVCFYTVYRLCLVLLQRCFAVGLGIQGLEANGILVGRVAYHG